MSSHSTQTESEIEAAQRAEDAQFYRAILHGVIDMANRLAQQICQDATAPVEDAVPGTEARIVSAAEATIAFDRMARTIRRCIMLARKVCEPVSIRTAADAGQRRVAARKQVIRQVEDAIHREAEAYEADGLRAELAERMDAPEFEDDLDRPIAEIIREIQADLGVIGGVGAVMWKRRTPQDVAALCALAAAPPRRASGPFNLPMPPADWLDPGARSDGGVPRCRGGP